VYKHLRLHLYLHQGAAAFMSGDERRKNWRHPLKLGFKHRNVMDRLWAALPEGWQLRLTPLARNLDMLFVDHGFIRAMYLNLHPVSDTLELPIPWSYSRPYHLLGVP